MLTILGKSYPFCDRIARRNFLTISGSLMGGFGLAPLLKAEAQQAGSSRHKAVIIVFLPGGPSHIDLFDLKPDAPVEIRGEFKPIQTNVSGVVISELLPRLARTMDKLVLIRSVVGGVDEHASNMCLTGHPFLGSQPAGRWPAVGAVISKLQGNVDASVPPFVNLAAPMIQVPYNDPGPGFLGASHRAFTADGEGITNLVLNGITLDQLQDRRRLLQSFDSLRRDIDASGTFTGIDAFKQTAFRTIISSRLRDALDISQEDPRIRDRYGKGDSSLVEGFNAAPRPNEHFLIARRLVEAGARCVTLAFGAWDWHEKNFEGHRQQTPLLDQGVSALVEDLCMRGLDKDVTVVVWGEFGRSPRINNTAGRDHWPMVSCALLAGGGMRTGQVVGATTRLGEIAKDRPVHFREVIATLYHNLGIDASRMTIPDLSGRPQHLLENHQPIAELV